jgi:hypothetical protein
MKTLLNQHIIRCGVSLARGLVAQLGWSVRLIIERSPVQIRLGPPKQNFIQRHFFPVDDSLYFVWLTQLFSFQFDSSEEII